MVHPDQAQSQTRTSGTQHHVTDLVERARDGDRAAFEQLVDFFHEPIFRMVYYRTRSRMDAEDLTQEIFIKAFNNLSKLRDVEKFRAWLFRTAVNRVRDFYRKRQFFALFRTMEDDSMAEPADMEIQDDPEALDHVIRQEFWSHVKSFSNRLSRWEREVFFLRFMDHLGIRDIAQVLDKSESAVKTHLYRALKKFRGDSMLHQLLQG